MIESCSIRFVIRLSAYWTHSRLRPSHPNCPTDNTLTLYFCSKPNVLDQHELKFNPSIGRLIREKRLMEKLVGVRMSVLIDGWDMSVEKAFSYYISIG